MTNFSHVESFKHYVDKISKDADLKMLSDYVLDEIFEHDEKTDVIHIFKNLSLKKIREYNDLVYRMKGEVSYKKTFSAALDVFQFMKQNFIQIGFFFKLKIIVN